MFLKALCTRFITADAKVIEIKDGVEQEREAAVSLVPPHRVICKHYDMAFANGHIYHGCFAGQLRSPRKHSADQQILLRRESQNNPWTDRDGRYLRGIRGRRRPCSGI